MAAVSEKPKQKRIAIIGGGLVGSLNAIYFAKRGFKVDLYESRKDPRSQEFVQGRSINLALSVRGIESLKAVGAHGPMVEGGIPMYARMIHPRNGKKYAIPYGKKDQCILSVERRKMNEHLLTVAETYVNVDHHFEHKLVHTDLENGRVTCSWDDTKVEINADLIVGCDGAYSTIRKEMMRKPRFDYSQTYIPHGYKELRLRPTQDGQFAIEVNYLHIWPRNTFMLIALPNQDRSFTCTLFFPFEQFDMLTNREEVIKFFSREFPDFKDLMGEEYLVEEFFKNPTGPMVSIKCKPYHVKDKAVIMGDAAHAMVPFYGQGMNCGFEDCLVLDGLVEKHNNNIGAALADYSRTRNPDAEAICDLAMYNYIEMRSSVNSTLFLAKKKLYSFLNSLMPKTIIPLYTMVTFSRIPYHIVIERDKFQEKVGKKICERN
ncbi:kynurenine 3-monooxygenase-like [Actinia tenebrosa]|uniref:Kynurenine 3-monooxygenase n=1 Tax=Actinia tenebrosa TaxID=6105 RepID=A0A6P8ITR1_ACTTE|nr:kynurenine 3-monooxygenase-like [Actinia tenebrosa]